MSERNKGGGQPGNKNARKSKAWENALRMELASYETDTVQKGTALRAIAKKCVEQAIAGDDKARTEIGNRLDGKAREHVELDFTHRLAQELTDDELLNIARGSGDRADAEKGSSEESSELH